MQHLNCNFGGAFSCFNWLFIYPFLPALNCMTLVFICLYLSLYCKLIFMTINLSYVRLPWFRVHIVVLNDVGRLLSATFDALCFSLWLVFFYDALWVDCSRPFRFHIQSYIKAGCLCSAVCREAWSYIIRVSQVSWRSNS